jgi:hypothetical protein
VTTVTGQKAIVAQRVDLDFGPLSCWTISAIKRIHRAPSWQNKLVFDDR